MNNIYIYTIATGEYQYYFNYFIDTIKNFYSDYDKTLIVLSDGLNKYNNMYINKCNIKVKHIYNTHPKLLTINKFNMLEDIIKDENTDDDLIFYFDIDTRFGKNEYTESLMIKRLNNDNVVNFSRHPHELYWPEWIIHGNNGIYNDNKYNFDTINKSCSCFTTDKSKHEIITSFLFTKKQPFIKLNSLVNSYIKEDMKRGVIIPLVDEDYINYIWYLQYSNQIDERYINVSDNFFITINKEYENTNDIEYYTDNYSTKKINEFDKTYIFIDQKYLPNIKKKNQE